MEVKGQEDFLRSAGDTEIQIKQNAAFHICQRSCSKANFGWLRSCLLGKTLWDGTFTETGKTFKRDQQDVDMPLNILFVRCTDFRMETLGKLRKAQLRDLGSYATVLGFT